MSLPNFALMKDQPDLLLDWLDNNILTAAALNNGGNNDPHWVTIIPKPLATGLSFTDEAIDVYELTTKKANEDNGMKSYICNYSQGDVHQQNIDAHADYCFTANMNGCTFAIGPSVDDQITVAHANAGGKPDDQRTQISNVFGGLGGLKLLEPAMYRKLAPNNNLQATTFGIRTGENWDFYFQSYEPRGQGTYKLYTVAKI